MRPLISKEAGGQTQPLPEDASFAVDIKSSLKKKQTSLFNYTRFPTMDKAIHGANERKRSRRQTSMSEFAVPITKHQKEHYRSKAESILSEEPQDERSSSKAQQ